MGFANGSRKSLGGVWNGRGRRLSVAAAILAVVAMLTVASATPPNLPPIPEIIDWSSIGTVVGVAGAAILSVVFLYAIGFRLLKKLAKRVTSSV